VLTAEERQTTIDAVAPRSAAQESEETTKTLQRYVERRPGRPPGKD
jgi:hypothetical protein